MASMKGSEGLFPEEELEGTDQPVDVAPLRSDRLSFLSGVNKGLSQYMTVQGQPAPLFQMTLAQLLVEDVVTI